MRRTATAFGLCLAIALGTLSTAEAATSRGKPAARVEKARRGKASAVTAKKKWKNLRLRPVAKADQTTTEQAAAGTRPEAGVKRPGRLTRITSAARRVPRAIRDSVIAAARWSRANPVKAAALATGAAAMMVTVIWGAPALKGATTGMLEPIIGAGLAGIAGIGLGGALASGSRSLMVHITPMVTGLDPWNRKQLAVDVGMSTGFGFIGFAQAAGMTALTDSVAVGTVATAGTMLVSLVGYEMVKDFLQVKIRNRVASYPKNFFDRRTFTDLLKMEVATNGFRALPGMSTVYWLKVVADIGGTIWYDRSVNRHENEEPTAREKKQRAGGKHPAVAVAADG